MHYDGYSFECNPEFINYSPNTNKEVNEQNDKVREAEQEEKSSENSNKVDSKFESEQRELLHEMVINNDGKKFPSLLDGFDECILYYYEDEDYEVHAVYCYEELVEHFAKTNKCSYTEAVEYVDFNVMRTIPYMYCIRYEDKDGNVQTEKTNSPIIIHRLKYYETNLDKSFFED